MDPFSSLPPQYSQSQYSYGGFFPTVPISHVNITCFSNATFGSDNNPKSTSSTSSINKIEITNKTVTEKATERGSVSITKSKLMAGLEIQGEVVVKEKSEIIGKTHVQGKLRGNDSTFEDIELKGEVELDSCHAKSLMFTSNSCRISSCCIEKLENRGAIDLTNTIAEEVKSTENHVVAAFCNIDKVESTKCVDIQSSVINKSLVVNVDCDQKDCSLILKGTELRGDLTINATVLKGHGPTITMSNAIPYDYSHPTTLNSINDIPDNIKKDVMRRCQENVLIRIGNLECIIRNRELQIYPLTLERINSDIRAFCGDCGENTVYLKYKGGEFSVTKDKIKVIKAPPDLVQTEETATASESIPSINVTIIGGNIQGQITFVGCKGNVVCAEGALIKNQQ